VIAGISVFRYEYVEYLDADGPISPEGLHGMGDYWRDVHCVVTTQWIRGASGVGRATILDRVAGRAWNCLIHSLFFLPLRGTQERTKFFRGLIARSLLHSVALTNRAFVVDLRYQLRREGP
jgi:hypothetical protein